jgi:hypothetical protein
MKHGLLALLVALCAPVFAQQPVPEIPFDGVNPLTLPTNMYLGEVTGVAVNSKGHIFAFSRGNTSGPAYAAAAAQLLEFDARGNPSGKSVRTSTHGPSGTRYASTIRTTSGSPTRARTW